MEARIIKETVNAARRKAICDLGGKLTKNFSPIVVIMTPSTKMLSIHGKDRVEKYIYVDKIPEGIELIRLESRINSGVIFSDRYTTIVRMFAASHDVMVISRAFNNSVISVLAANGIEARVATHRPDSNDIVFVQDGKEKKFCGVVTDPTHNYFSFFFTFTFDKAHTKDLYRLDSNKFKNRGDIQNVADVVGGLTEVNPNISRNVVEDVINSICEKMGWTPVSSTFTPEEELLINQ